MTCPYCSGYGSITDYETECCGNYLATGECCAAQYGTANLIMVPVEELCPNCGGNGFVPE